MGKSVLKIGERQVRPLVFAASFVFLCLAVLYFAPVKIPHKISFPLATLTVAGLWLLPWEMCLAMFCSFLGDYAGSCGSFIMQMLFFALAHAWMIFFFVRRYLAKVEHDRKLTGKAKGYMIMVLLCAEVLLAVALTKVAPCAPAGIIRTGVCIYATMICAMMVTALMQRSSLYALGAVLFVFSDFILAWNRFVEPIPGQRYLIMVPYYLGQWLLFVRSTPYRIRNQVKLMRF